MAGTKKNWLKKIFRLFVWLFVLQLLYIIFCKWINPPFTLTQVGSVISGHGLKRDYVSYDEMSPNIKHPTRRRGASTISQQVAKNVFLWQGGGYFRKGLEVYFTFMIEKAWSKKRILQTYLNVAEMGPGIFGVQAAAKAYFKKDAINLTRQEAAMIAACLPNPKRYTVKPLSGYVAVRSRYIQRQMSNLQTDPDIRKVIGLGPP